MSFAHAALCLSLVLAGFALSMISLASRPRRLLGIRIGYAYVDEYCWRMVNAIAASITLSLGAAGAILYALMGSIGPVVATALGYAITIPLVVLLGERIAEKRLLSIPNLLSDARVVRIEGPSPLVITLLLAVTTIFVASSVTYALAYYPRLPSRIAIHFSASGAPDAYAPKGVGLATIVLIELGVYSMCVALAYAALRKPEAFYRPWLGPGSWKRIALALNAIASSACVVLSLALIDLVTYNATRLHAIPLQLVTAISLTLVATSAAYATLLEARGSRYA